MSYCIVLQQTSPISSFHVIHRRKSWVMQVACWTFLSTNHHNPFPWISMQSWLLHFQSETQCRNQWWHEKIELLLTFLYRAAWIGMWRVLFSTPKITYNWINPSCANKKTRWQHHCSRCGQEQICVLETSCVRGKAEEHREFLSKNNTITYNT